MANLPYNAGQDVTVGAGGSSLSAGPGALTPTIDTPYVVRLFGDEELAAFAVRDDTDGSPTPPSQKQQRVGLLRGVFVPCEGGVRVAISIDCKYTPQGAPVPRIILKANPSVGLPDDIASDVPDGTGWVTVETTPFVPTADGVVEVWREQRQPGSVCWDRLVVST